MWIYFVGLFLMALSILVILNTGSLNIAATLFLLGLAMFIYGKVSNKKGS